MTMSEASASGCSDCLEMKSLPAACLKSKRVSVADVRWLSFRHRVACVVPVLLLCHYFSFITVVVSASLYFDPGSFNRRTRWLLAQSHKFPHIAALVVESDEGDALSLSPLLLFLCIQCLHCHHGHCHHRCHCTCILCISLMSPAVHSTIQRTPRIAQQSPSNFVGLGRLVLLLLVLSRLPSLLCFPYCNSAASRSGRHASASYGGSSISSDQAHPARHLLRSQPAADSGRSPICSRSLFRT
mmetsp:Transcript_24086/g.67200  ORF Transcript_24086/g.67200 Transcript_24086/m.67200 type:complete len:242 (-) Transcript_24086:243-968(-)